MNETAGATRRTAQRARIRQYLSKRAEFDAWPLVCAPCDGIETAVVIPALAECDNLLRTLRSLSENSADELRRTLVVCVVNNRADADLQDIADNARALVMLEAAVRGDRQPELDGAVAKGLRLAYVDASSPGFELPAKRGVGTARKIGLDWATSVLDSTSAVPGILISLDADTIVEPAYLESLRATMERGGAWAAAIPYAHGLEGAPDETSAIICYEIFLRYYVLGLAHAGSPYAFHSIGSAMACTTDAYAAVSGMNHRMAGEDFYFLQQLAKTGSVRTVHGTVVHPSPRASHRVPFGTGQRVRRFLDASQDEYLLYAPESFAILKAWLTEVCKNPQETAETLGKFARGLSPTLSHFLDKQEFATVWPRLQRNARDSMQLVEQFHRWFDGFRTLKLVHALRDEELPLCNMFEAVATLLEWSGHAFTPRPSAAMRGDIDAQIALLRHLRSIEQTAVRMFERGNASE